jgi:hypothetical protein
MTAVSYDNLRTRALQVMNEIAGFANSETRVGSLFRDMVDSMAGTLGVFSVQGYGALTTNDGATNDTAIGNAIAAALAANAELYWQSGTYPSAASIPNFHSVRHYGPGAIQRGSDVFYVQPSSSQTNRLYLSSTGNSANDGLSSSQPMATPQNAFDALKNYGPMLDGAWRIVCAAGTWNGTVHRHIHTTPSKNAVIVEGPSVGGHPNVPTAIFDGATGPLADDWCMAAYGYGVQLDIRDVKAQNYIGSSDSNGFYAGYGASFFWSNLHVGGTTSFAAIYLQGCTTVRGSGGIWGNTGGNSHGAYVNGCNDVTIGASGAPVRINGANVGVEWSRGSQGHIDYCELNDCAYAVDIFHDSRVHLLSNNFKRSTVTAVRARSGGYYYDSSNTFNEGTADANAKKFLNYVAAGETDEDFWFCQGARRRAYDKNSYSHTGTTNVTAIGTLLTGAANSRIKAYWFEDDTKEFVVKIWGRWTTSALSAVSISLGGTEMGRHTLTSLPTAGSDFRYEATVSAKSANVQQCKYELHTDGQSPKFALSNTAVATSADLSVNANLKLAASGNTAEIYWMELWLVG